MLITAVRAANKEIRSPLKRKESRAEQYQAFMRMWPTNRACSLETFVVWQTGLSTDEQNNMLMKMTSKQATGVHLLTVD